MLYSATGLHSVIAELSCTVPPKTAPLPWPGSVRGRLLDMIDYQDSDRALLRFQLQTELLL
jgi:hypothetical protein